jgi:hypothetical protein
VWVMLLDSRPGIVVPRPEMRVDKIGRGR